MRWLTGALAVAVLLGGSFYAAQASGQGSWRAEPVQYATSGSHVGLGLRDIDADRASVIKLGEPRGVEVMVVQPNSPAESAGFKAGDVLLTYNGEDILSVPQIGRLVGETPAGRRVKIQYWREGKIKTTTVVTAGSNAAAAEPQPSRSNDAAWGVPAIPRMLMIWEDIELGIACEPLDPQLAQFFGVRDGILVRSVGKGYPGEKAGLKAGDVITGIDARSLATPRDLISYLRAQQSPRKTVSISVVREHKARTFSVTVDE